MSTDLPTNCPFCDDTQQYRFITETELVRAIYPKSPACNFHMLLVPKTHRQTLDELTEDELQQLFQLLQRTVRIAREQIPGFIGYNVLSNNGSEAVNQRVKHAHVHLFLRTEQETGNPLEPSHSHEPLPLTDEQKNYMKQLQTWLQ